MAREFKVEGFKELDEQLGRLRKTAAKAALRKAGKATLEPTARLARQMAPEDEDYLSEHIEVSTRTTVKDHPEGRYTVNVYMGPAKEAFHGVWQEHGTTQHGPQPFMRPAWDQDRGNMIERLRLELWDTISTALDRAAKRGDL